ncbi:Ribophorin I-domain-containing protein [Cladochytrium replicatum]|nr:Ribophorin I-domain-containing protein [Cladochytrium replicatum]
MHLSRTSTQSAMLRVLLLVLTCASQLLAAPPSNFVNVNVARTIDLTSPSITRVSISISAKNAASESVGEYYLAVPLAVADKLGYIGVDQVNADNKKVKLVITPDKVEASRKVQYYKAELAEKAAAGSTISLVVTESYLAIAAPYPKEVEQIRPQSLKFDDNLHYFSPYPSEKLKTVVKVRTQDVIDSTPYDSKSMDKLTYEFKNVSPLSRRPLSVHWTENKAILVLESLQRELIVSHWGNLAVEENFELHHRGAKLRGHFSRNDYQFTAHAHHMTNVVKELKFTLPRQASDVYFKDQVGNVSTSRFRNERTKSILELRPRYPLYGGWKYTWFHGYNAPLKDFVKYDPENGNYVFQFNFLGGLSDIPVEKGVVKVVLPEGATDIKVLAPFVVKESRTVSFSYFDTIGRPTIILEKLNLVDEHAVPVQVVYKFHQTNLLRKPVAVAVGVLALLIVSMLYARLDLSITEDKAADLQLRLQSYRTTVYHMDKSSSHIFKSIDDAFDSFKDSRKEKERFEFAPFERQINDVVRSLNETADEAGQKLGESAETKSFISHVRALSSNIEERCGKVKGSLALVVALLLTADGGDVDEKKKKEVAAGVQKTDAEVKALEAKAKKIVDDL